MATLDDDDLKNIRILIDQSFDDKLDEKLDEKLNHLPKKDEFYAAHDEQMTELKAIREELTVLSGQVSDHSDRLDDLEKIHPQGTHVSS